jgi:hypothetical protein
LRAFETWRACGIQRTRRWSDDTWKHGFYLGSAPAMGNDLRPACMTLLMWWLPRLITMEAYMRSSLRWRALKIMSAQVHCGEKCLEAFLDLPPNLLYAKVGSRDCFPSQLQRVNLNKP